MKLTKIIISLCALAPSLLLAQSFQFNTTIVNFGDVLTSSGAALPDGALLSYGTMSAAPGGIDVGLDAGLYTEIGSATFSGGDVTTGIVNLAPGTEVWLWAFNGPAIDFGGEYALFGGFEIPALGSVLATPNNVSLGTSGSLVYGSFAGTSPDSIQLVPVPEPSTFALLGGVLALGFVMYRRRKA